MRSDRLALTRGSGNVFRDLGHEDADVKQCKAILAAEIIKALDRQGLSVRDAHDRTGIEAAVFSRIRDANLRGFTVDRLRSIVYQVGCLFDLRIKPKAAQGSASLRSRKSQARTRIRLDQLNRKRDG